MRILIAEDERITRRTLERQVAGWGHEVVAVEDGLQAWEAFSQATFDAVLTDWQMPGLPGCDLVRRIRAATRRFVYVMMLTSRSDAEDAAAGLDAGADDFVRKPVEQTELRARLAAGERIVKLERALESQNARMQQDLAAGARYVRSMIPPPVAAGLPRVDWRYVPATDLAGDSLGYHPLDDSRLAFYVLDVTGHGLDAALLSVTVLNVVRSMSLPDTDFGSPGEVLASLNDRFPMEEHEDRCFTMWYGVYDKNSGQLTWAGGGHPDALLLEPAGGLQRLGSTGPMLGMLSGCDYDESRLAVPPGARLLLFSDGVYEIEQPDGRLWTYDAFADYASRTPPADLLDGLLRHVQALGGRATLDDDFTLLQLGF